MNAATVTAPAECWRIYQEEKRQHKHGAITRTFGLVKGYTYMSLRRMLQAGSSTWLPALQRQWDNDYEHTLPNGVVLTIKRHYYLKGVITDSWWHLHWPTYIDAEHYPLRTINLVHQIDTLKEARALIAEYVANDYTVPEGACTL